MESSTPPPSPPHLPKPTVWPATTALAVTLVFWGLITSVLVSLMGLAVFAVAITGWIGDIRHERQR